MIVIGVDLGGTNVRAQAFAEDGSPQSNRVEIESRAQSGIDACLDAVAEAIESVQGQVNAARIGIAIPGHVDDEHGVVRWAPNFGEERDGIFYYWENVPFREPLSKRIKLPMVLGNDANLAALGEYKFGSGKNCASCLVMLTLGTGIGGGVVFSPQSLQGQSHGSLLLLGGNKGGAELGHTIIQQDGLDSTAGAYGTLEAYCNRDALIHRTVNRINRGVDSVIAHRVAGDWSRITPLIIGEAAADGDELALQIWSDFGAFLGVGIGSMINVFAPQVVAVGGQIAKSWDFFESSLKVSARDTAIPSLFKDARITLAEQLEDAGILGAAAIALENS